MPFLLFLAVTTVSAQRGGTTPEVSVTLRLDPSLVNAQSFSFSNLGINTNGSGNRIFEFIIENASQVVQTDLHFDLVVNSSRHGVIAEAYTEQHNTFSLNPGQVIFGNNNSLQSGLSTVGVNFLSGGLTPAGENLLNQLEGSTRLPDAVYSITISLYRGQNRLNGGRLLVSSTGSIGARPIQNVVDFFLIQPGGPLGSGDQTTSRLPIFRWDGPIDFDYRLLVVRDNGQRAQSLLEGARSTAPTMGRNATGTNLMEYEMIDAIVTGNTFQYPSAGVPQLQEGNRYFWQLIALIPAANGVEERPSSIMEFRIPSLANQASNAYSPEVVEEAKQILEQLSPELAGTLNQLLAEGFEMDSFMVDGVRYSGNSIVVFMEQFLRRVQNGEIILANQ